MAATVDLWEQQSSPEAGSAPLGISATQLPRWGWHEVTRHAAWRVRVATVTLWLLIALAAAGGLRALAGAPPAAAASSLAGTEAASAASGFAEQYVAASLEAGAGDSLAAFYPGPVDLDGVTASARYVSRASAVSAEPLGPGYWAVTVATEVLDQVAGGYEQAGTWYYRVGVHAGSHGDVATSLPALVPAPSPAPLPRLAAPLPSSAPPDALGTALTHFFATYLSGAGPPLSAVTVTAVSLGPTPAGAKSRRNRIAEVELTATDAGGRAQLLAYAVRLAQTPSGWTVQTVLAAAPLVTDHAQDKEGHP